MLKAINFLALAAVACCLMTTTPAKADVITWTTGDLGNNVISNAGDFEVNPILINPSNSDPATLDVKFGLWNSPAVPVDVFLNGSLVGSLVASSGYLAPGPQFAMFDVSGLLLDGLNTLLFTGNGVNSGDYVIGQADLNYSSGVVPEPSSMITCLIGAAMGGCVLRWRLRS
jgi:hypothetical protein